MSVKRQSFKLSGAQPVSNICGSEVQLCMVSNMSSSPALHHHDNRRGRSSQTNNQPAISHMFLSIRGPVMIPSISPSQIRNTTVPQPTPNPRGAVEAEARVQQHRYAACSLTCIDWLVSDHRSQSACTHHTGSRRSLEDTNSHPAAECLHDHPTPSSSCFNAKCSVLPTHTCRRTLMSAGQACNGMDLVFSLRVVFIIYHVIFFPPEEEGEDIILGLGNEGNNFAFSVSVSHTHTHTHTAQTTV